MDVPFATRREELVPSQVDRGERCTTFHLGRAGGSRRLYAAIDRLEAGAVSAKLHAHAEQEEFFLVLRVHVRLRTDRGERHLEPGDFFCKPAGTGLAHPFVNDGLVDAGILDVGLVAPSDVVTDPDEGVALVKALGLAFRMADARADWTGDPDAKPGR